MSLIGLIFLASCYYFIHNHCYLCSYDFMQYLRKPLRWLIFLFAPLVFLVCVVEILKLCTYLFGKHYIKEPGKGAFSYFSAAWTLLTELSLGSLFSIFLTANNRVPSWIPINYFIMILVGLLYPVFFLILTARICVWNIIENDSMFNFLAPWTSNPDQESLEIINLICWCVILCGILLHPIFSNLLRDLYQYRLKTNFYVKDWSLSEVKKTGIKYYASTTVNNVHTKDSRDYDHFAFSTEKHNNYKLSTAMSLSGAAVSIRMGHIDRGFTSVIMRLFLSLFNINLGGWIRKSEIAEDKKNETGTGNKVPVSKVMSWYNTGLATIFALSIPVIGIIRSGVNLGNPGPNTIFIIDMIILAIILVLFLLFLFSHFLIIAGKLDFENEKKKFKIDLSGALPKKIFCEIWDQICDEENYCFMILQIIRGAVIVIVLALLSLIILLSLVLIIICVAIVVVVGILIALIWCVILLVFAFIGFVFSNAFVLLKDGYKGGCDSSKKKCFNPFNLFYIFDHCSLFRTIKLILGLRQFEDSPYLFHSDGGHFDNLGLYALLNRSLDDIEEKIFVFDAGADEELSLGSLYDVLYFAEKDGLIKPIFGKNIPESNHVDTLSRKIGARKVFERSSSCCIKFVLEVYGEEKNQAICKKVTIYYAKATTTGEEPGSLKLHMLNNPVFPYEPTPNQHIGETKFEAYKSLGYYVAGEVFDYRDLQQLHEMLQTQQQQTQQQLDQLQRLIGTNQPLQNKIQELQQLLKQLLQLNPPDEQKIALEELHERFQNRLKQQ